MGRVPWIVGLLAVAASMSALLFVMVGASWGSWWFLLKWVVAIPALAMLFHWHAGRV